MAILLKVDGSMESLPKVPDLAEAQRLVGGYVEMLCTLDDEPNFLLCDEEGRLKGRIANTAATMAFGRGEVLVGDVVLLSQEEALESGWLGDGGDDHVDA